MFIEFLNTFFMLGGTGIVALRGHSTTTWTELCHFLPPPLPCVDIFYTLSVDKKKIYFCPPPPHLVHVVIEYLKKTLKKIVIKF